MKTLEIDIVEETRYETLMEAQDALERAFYADTGPTGLPRATVTTRVVISDDRSGDTGGWWVSVERVPI